MDEVRWIAGEPPPPWWHRWRWPMVTLFVIGAGLCFLLYALVARQKADQARQRLELARPAFTEAKDLLKQAEAAFERGDEIEASNLATSALRRVRGGSLWRPDNVECLHVVDRALSLIVATDKERQALADEVLAPCGDMVEARLIRLRLRVEPLLDRWAVVAAVPSNEATRPDPGLEELRNRVREDCDALLSRELPEPDAQEVRALRAFVDWKPMTVGTGALLCNLWVFRAVRERDPRRACNLVQPYGQERRWQALSMWVHAHAVIDLHRKFRPFEEVPLVALALLESLPRRFHFRPSYWIDHAACQTDPIAAEQDIRGALERSPGEPVLFALWAELAERRGDKPREASLRTLAQGAQADPTARLVAQAQDAEENRDFVRARAAYDELCARLEVAPVVRRRRAALLLRMGALEEALADAEAAHAAEPDDSALALVADALTACGRPEEALARAVGGTSALFSARSRALRALGRLEEAWKEAVRAFDWAEAAVCLLRMGRLDEAEGQAQRSNSALAYDVLARIAVAHGDWSKAAGWNRFALRDDPLLASSHVVQATLHVHEQRFDQAVESLGRAIELDPRSWEAWRALAEVHHDQGKDAEALDALARIPASEPRDLGFFALRSRLHARQGLTRKAIADLDEAIRFQPGAFSLILQRAELKLVLEDWTGVRADAELALSKVRRAAQPRRLIALADLAEGRLEAAEKGFDETILRSPKDVTSRLARATLRMARGDRASAREDLTAAVEADFGDALALYRLLQMDVEEGRWEDVLEEARRFTSLHPQDERAAQARQWLDDARAALR